MKIEIIIVIVVVLLILAFFFTWNNRLEGGYYHTLEFDDESVRCLNELMGLIDFRSPVYMMMETNSFAKYNDIEKKKLFMKAITRAKSINDVEKISRQFGFENFFKDMMIEYERQGIKPFFIHNTEDYSNFGEEQYVGKAKYANFNSAKGYQILNNRVNVVKIRRMPIEEIDAINRHKNFWDESVCNDNFTEYCYTVSYPKEDRKQFTKHVTGYKGVPNSGYMNYGEYGMPLKLLMVGYELANDSAGQSSGIGMYVSPMESVTVMYSGSRDERFGKVQDISIVYRYDIGYERYYYSQLNVIIDDDILRFVTHDFSEEFANELTPEAKDLILLLRSAEGAGLPYLYKLCHDDEDYEDWPSKDNDYAKIKALLDDEKDEMKIMIIKHALANIEYNRYSWVKRLIDDDKILKYLTKKKTELLDRYANQYHNNKLIDLLNSPVFISAAHSTTYLAKDDALESYYDSLNIDLIVSCTDSSSFDENDKYQISDMFTYDRYKVYEIVARRGEGVLISGILTLSTSKPTVTHLDPNYQRIMFDHEYKYKSPSEDEWYATYNTVYKR